MRRTKKQIKQLILEAMTSTPKVIKTSEIMKATGLSHTTVMRYKEEIYCTIINFCKAMSFSFGENEKMRRFINS